MIVLVLVIMLCWVAVLVDVNGAFLIEKGAEQADEQLERVSVRLSSLNRFGLRRRLQVVGQFRDLSARSSTT